MTGLRHHANVPQPMTECVLTDAKYDICFDMNTIDFSFFFSFWFKRKCGDSSFVRCWMESFDRPTMTAMKMMKKKKKLEHRVPFNLIRCGTNDNRTITADG